MFEMSQRDDYEVECTSLVHGRELIFGCCLMAPLWAITPSCDQQTRVNLTPPVTQLWVSAVEWGLCWAVIRVCCQRLSCGDIMVCMHIPCARACMWALLNACSKATVIMWALGRNPLVP